MGIFLTLMDLRSNIILKERKKPALRKIQLDIRFVDRQKDYCCLSKEPSGMGKTINQVERKL